MSPQAALVEFIATSASYHGVRRQTLTELEDDLFRVSLIKLNRCRGFNNYVDNDEGGEGKKNVHARGGVKKGQNSVHVVIE